MSKVIAAIDNSVVARAVLEVAAAAAGFLQAELEAVHVSVPEGRAGAAAEAAAAAGVPLRTIEDPDLAALLAVGSEDDVRALVAGARSDPRRRRPAGHVALGLLLELEKPLLAVPPRMPPGYSIERILVPLDGTSETAATLRATIELAHDAGVEVVPLHVLDEASLPLFSDQPQHEADAWRREFLARHSPHPERQRLETRVGLAPELVLAVADETHADLIALGWSQNLAPGRAAVVRDVLDRSDVPVLLLPVARPQ